MTDMPEGNTQRHPEPVLEQPELAPERERAAHLASPPVVNGFHPPARGGELPLVSIGVPTYNRAAGLRRALDSARAQDYPRLEIVVSDNASSDETRRVCEEAAAADPRVRYVRQPENVGAIRNFAEVLRRSSGEFFMWLADDDWLHPSYVSACAQALARDPDLALVCGRAEYWLDGRRVFDGCAITLLQERPVDRVVGYYRQVGENGTFYGLIRREMMDGAELGPLMGSDWMFVAALAARGKVLTLDSVPLYRSYSGMSVDLHRLARNFGVPAPWRDHPHLVVAANVFRDLSRAGAAFSAMPKRTRVAAASRAASSILYRFTVRPHLLPLFPRTGIVARARRVARRLSSVRE